jgi:outer membrane immunogenic protein
MKELLLAGVALTTLVAGPAMAADRARARVYRAPPRAAVVSWTGFYIGGNLGGAWSRESYVTAPGGTLVTDPFDGSLGWGAGLGRSSAAGFTGGGGLGYNWQMSNLFVVGVETDIQYYGATVTDNTAFFSAVAPADPGGFAAIANRVNSSTRWFGTLRGRIGSMAVSPSALIYVTGGLAYGRENITANVTATLPGSGLLETFPFATGSTNVGYTFGGGFEWMLDYSWSVKAEYLYVNLRATGGQTVPTTFLGPAAFSTDIMRFSSSRNELNVVRVGLNYRFGYTAVVGKY